MKTPTFISAPVAAVRAEARKQALAEVLDKLRTLRVAASPCNPEGFDHNRVVNTLIAAVENMRRPS